MICLTGGSVIMDYAIAFLFLDGFVMIHFSKSVPMMKQTHLQLSTVLQRIFIFVKTIFLTLLSCLKVSV